MGLIRVGFLVHASSERSTARSMAQMVFACIALSVPFRTQHPLGAVVNRPSVWSGS